MVPITHVARALMRAAIASSAAWTTASCGCGPSSSSSTSKKRSHSCARRSKSRRRERFRWRRVRTWSTTITSAGPGHLESRWRCASSGRCLLEEASMSA